MAGEQINNRSVEEWQVAMELWPSQIRTLIGEIAELDTDQYPAVLQVVESNKLHDKPHAAIWENYSALIEGLCNPDNSLALVRIKAVIDAASIETQGLETV